MKAKYFSDCSIIDARRGRRLPFVWRSIHSACSLLLKGLVCQVGNGEKFRIWQNTWIPQKSTFMIQSWPTFFAPTATVNELMVGEAHEWNQALVEQNFSTEEVKIIFSIPLSRTSQEDVLILRGTTKGVFSVRSAYHMQKEVEEETQAECSSHGPTSEVWGRLWKLPVPNMENNFLWKACHDILSTRVNLHRRKVLDDPKCPIYGRDDETTAHILWKCSSVIDVWGKGLGYSKRAPILGNFFFQIVEEMFWHCNVEEILQFVGVARRIWLRWNEVIHRCFFSPLVEVVKRTRTIIIEYQAVKLMDRPACVTKRQTQWMAPPVGWLMVNWDVAINRSRGWWGLGVIICDHLGNLIASKCSTHLGGLEPVAAEALAALEAMQFCHSLGHDWVQFVGDAKLVVDVVFSGEPDWSSKGHLIDAIRSSTQRFSHWKISHVNRVANQIVHALARLATTQFMENVFTESPTCIKDVLAFEQSVIHH